MGHTYTNLLTHIICGFLSPLPGLVASCARDPRLAPWATVCRRSAASGTRAIGT
jgi:hypothetical protein